MDETVETAAPVLKQYYGKDKKMSKPKISKEVREKISDKIKYLVDKEGRKPDQAIAMAYAIEAPKYSKAKKKK